MHAIRCALFCSLAVSFANQVASAEPGEVLAGWREAQKNLRSLRVEFTKTRVDPIFSNHHESEGIFQFAFGPDSEPVASLALHDEKSRHEDHWFFRGRVAYLLDHRRKAALRMVPEDDSTLTLRDTVFPPARILTNHNLINSDANWKFKADGDSQLYAATIIEQANLFSWWNRSTSVQAEFLSPKHVTSEQPSHMPKYARFTATGEHAYDLYEIKAWRLNEEQSLTRADLQAPEVRPGWEVDINDPCLIKR